MFSVHTTPEEFKNATINLRSFWICVWGNLGQGNHVIIMTSSFRKAPFSKCFPSTRKRKAAVFKFPRFGVKNVSEIKAPFSWRISVDGRPNRRNKAAFSWRISVDGRPNRRNKAPFSWRISVEGRPKRGKEAVFSNFSGVVWTGPLNGLEKKETKNTKGT